MNMNEHKHFYAVLIGDIYTPQNAFNEAVFSASNAAEARKRGNLYIRQWGLEGARVLRVRRMSEQEYNERVNDHEQYIAGGYKKYIAAQAI